jgi:SAM-dependent methyltransferase
MKMHKKNEHCRLCGSKNLKLIFKMPACPPVDNYRFASEPEINHPSFPMDLYMCAGCGHAQLLDVVSPNLLFGNYIYTSGSSTDLDKHFQSYSASLISRFNLGRESFIIDIGSNDGLFLSKFLTDGISVLGIDPARLAAEKALAAGIPTKISFINREVVGKVISELGLADIVSANNVFSHSDDLRGFAECARDLLKTNGVFVFEVSYLLDLVEGKVVDYIYHEHLAHHSVRPLRIFFESLGMKLIDVERVQTKGGSIRVFTSRSDSERQVNDSVGQLEQAEHFANLYSLETYRTLQNFMLERTNQVVAILTSVKSNGGKIASYGASATATVINQMMNINQFFSFIIDDNQDRQGRLSPGCLIPVKSRNSLTVEQPDLVVISSWRFSEEIISKNKEYLEAGGRFLVPLLELKVVTS